MKHKHEPKVCAVEDVFDIKGDSEESLKVVDKIAKYLSVFVAPCRDEEGKPVCFHCGAKIDGLMQALSIGYVAYRWGLTHGEATCSGCGWPARGMHYPKDEDGEPLFTLRNFFLAYHPDVLEKKNDKGY